MVCRNFKFLLEISIGFLTEAINCFYYSTDSRLNLFKFYNIFVTEMGSLAFYS